MKKLSHVRIYTFIAMLFACVSAFAAYGNNVLSPIAAPRLYLNPGQTDAQAMFTCVNNGNNPITSFHYKATMNGKVIEEKDVILSQPLPSTESYKLLISVPKLTELGDYQMVCEIPTVNKQYNETSFPFSTIDMTVLTKIPTQRVVFEDYTARWCQACPRGTAIMEYLEKKYPNEFIGIAIHNRDGMTLLGYQSKHAVANGYPTIWAGRKSTVGGFTGKDEFEAIKRDGATMDVDVEAQWNTAGDEVKVKSTTTFRIKKADARYSLAYVLVENGLKSPGWAQNNDYSGQRRYLGINEELDFFINSPRSVYGLTYNNVARAFLGIEDGLPGSLPNKIEVDEPIQHNTEFKGVGSTWQITDKNNLHVVVLVIDNKTHRIVNAARSNVKPATTTGIETVNTAAERVEVARFNVNGQQLAAPQKGINIVKYSDGSVEKVQVTQ